MKTTEAVNDNFYLPIGRKFITPILPTSFKQQFSVKTANGLQFLAVVFFILTTVNYIFGIFLADFISGIVIYAKRNEPKEATEMKKKLDEVKLPSPKRPYIPSGGRNSDDSATDESTEIRPFKPDQLNEIELPSPKRPYIPSERSNDKATDQPAETKPKRPKKRSAKKETTAVTFELDGQTYNGTFDPDGNIVYTDENGQIQRLNKADFETETV